MSPHIKLGVVN